MFWADEIADRILARRPGKDLYRVHDYKTPSGRIHVGSLRGVVIHHIVAQAVKAHGVNVEYVYGFDDYDAMDGFPVYLPESFRQYMGQPLSEIPSPEEGYASYADYFAQEFMNAYHSLGIVPTLVRTSEMYKSGQFNETIRISLDNAAEIRHIYKEVSGAERRDDWYALNTVCEQCGKIGTTRVFAWDGEQVSYKCEPTMVKWAQGCGYEGKRSPFDGGAKMPWKVEWAAKWSIFENDFETAGKDHMTKNGSFDVAQQIVRRVFHKEEPLGREFPYEFLLVGGKKMSSSKGLGVSARDMVNLLPAHLVNYLIGKGKPNRQIDFEPGGNTVPLLYDDYDKALAAYHADPDSDEAKLISYIRTEDQVIPHYTMRFSKVAFLSQMPNVDIWQVAAEEKGSELSPEDKLELTERITYAKKWLNEFAPDEMRFELQQTMPTIELNDLQKTFLQQVLEAVEASHGDGPALHEKIHAIKTELEISPKEAFGAIYQLFLAKTSGPQAGWFLAALDKDFVVNRLREATV